MTKSICQLCGSEQGERVVGKKGQIILCRHCVSTLARRVFKVGRAETCPDYQPSQQGKESLIYHESPRFCGNCVHYDPYTASCSLNPSRVEMICTKCGAFVLETPGRFCPYCGSELAPISSNYEWTTEHLQV
ncbi:hypothetical protein [Desulfothermobacter acidiphilus]|uniref:hypothetical protein n=1 Tax=Desulfothermobacter acidiphilus TaxID=1938353 RepID=UPI003F8CA059